MSETDTGPSVSEASRSSVERVPGMKRGKTIRNILISLLYVATIWIWFPLLPLFVGLFVWRNWFDWATMLDRLPGIGPSGGLLSGVFAFLYVVVIFAMIGAAIGGPGPEDTAPPTGDNPASGVGDTTTSPTENPNLITKSEETMLPIIDDFESGWIQDTADESNRMTFYNVEMDTVVFFDVAAHETVESAQQEYRERKQKIRADGLSSESVDVGDKGFLYQLDREYVIVNFRVRNVVGRVEFDGPNVVTPETNAIRFARLLEEKIE